QGFGQERFEPLRRQRRNCTAAAQRRTHHLLERLFLCPLIAGRLGRFELLARLLDALTPLFELAERTVLIELRVAARVRTGAHTEAHTRDGGRDGGDYEVQNDGGDDRYRGVARRLLRRTLHGMRQSKIQEVDAVDRARQSDQPADRRNDQGDAGNPCGGVRVGDALE